MTNTTPTVRPVTTSGCYELQNGKYQYFAWYAGRLVVSTGELTAEEVDAIEAQDLGITVAEYRARLDEINS